MSHTVTILELPAAQVTVTEDPVDVIAPLTNLVVQISPVETAVTVSPTPELVGSLGLQQTLVDAKGDLIVGTAADTVARLAAGSNGRVLKTNSAAVSGLEWALGSEELGQVIDVVNRGAVGSGANDTAAIMETIEELGTSGGGIVWVADHYLVSTPTSSVGALLVAYDNIHFRGPGAGVASITSELASQGAIHFAGSAKPTGAYSGGVNWYARRTYFKVSPIAEGASTITFSRSADAATFAAGNQLWIRTGQLAGNTEHAQPDCETVEVLSVAGTTVTLKEPVTKSYAQEFFASGTAATTSTSIAANALSFNVVSAAGFAIGNHITIVDITDNEPLHVDVISNISSNTITVSRPITSAITSGATVTNGTGQTTTSSTAYPAAFGVANVTAHTIFNCSIMGLGIYNRFSTAALLPGHQVRGFYVENCLLGSRGAAISMGMTDDFYVGRNQARMSPQSGEEAYVVALGPGAKTVTVENNNCYSTGFSGFVMSEGTVHFDIVGNKILNCPTSSGSHNPIGVQTRSGHGTILRNKILNGGIDAAIYVDSKCSRGGIIDGNIVAGGNFASAYNVSSDNWHIGTNELGGKNPTLYGVGATPNSDQGVHYATGWIKHDNTSDTIVTLPANATVIDVKVEVFTAWTGTGTKDFVLGYSGSTSAYVSASASPSDWGTTGVKTPTFGARKDRYDATSRAVLASYQGTSPGAGKTRIIVIYVIDSPSP